MAIFLLIILLYRYMAFIVNEFISDGIIILVDTLKIPEALASVTFLALGNSAIDIIIVCVGAQNHEAASYVVGTLYGQGIFFSCVILSICIFSSPGKEICLEFVTVYRDIGLYLFMIVLTYLWAIGGVITWWKSMICLLVYVAWAAFVLYSERYGGRKTYSLEHVDDKSGEKYLEITKELVDSQAYYDEWISAGDEDKCKRYLDEVARTTDVLNEIISQPKPAPTAQERSTQTVDLNESDLPKDPEPDAALTQTQVNPLEPSYLDNLFRKFANSETTNIKICYFLRQKQLLSQLNKKPYSQLSTPCKILCLIDFPFTLLTYLTIFPIKYEDSHTPQPWITPLPALYFTLTILTSQYWALSFYSTGLPILALLYTLVLILKRAPTLGKKYYILFTLIGTFSSVLWTYIFAQLIIDMVDSLVNLYA